MPNLRQSSALFAALIVLLATTVSAISPLDAEGTSSPATAQVSPADRHVLATYTSGTVTAHDARTILQAEGEGRDPYADFLKANDEGNREEAAFWLDRAIRDVVWARHWDAVARDHGTTVPTDAEAMTKNMRGELALSVWMKNQSTPPPPTTDQIRALADSLAKELSHPESREVSYIFRQITPATTDEQARQIFSELSVLRTKIETGEISFVEAARRHSEASSAPSGGHIGPVTRQSTYNAQFIDLVFSTPTGGLSPVTKLRNGLYLVRVASVSSEVKLSAQDVLTSPVLKDRVDDAAQQLARKEQLAALQKRHGSASPQEAAIEELRATDTLTSEVEAAGEISRQRGRAMAYHHLKKNETATPPTETEIAEYYEKLKAGYVEPGIFKLTRFMVPVKPNVSDNLAEAHRQANDALKVLRAGTSPEKFRAKAGGASLVWETKDGWIQSSGIGPADMELLKLTPGEFSGVHETKEGAVFFRLDDRRSPPQIPLEKVRGDIVRKLTAANRRNKMMEEQDALLKALKLRMIWREINSYPAKQ